MPPAAARLARPDPAGDRLGTGIADVQGGVDDLQVNRRQAVGVGRKDGGLGAEGLDGGPGGFGNFDVGFGHEEIGPGVVDLFVGADVVGPAAGGIALGGDIDAVHLPIRLDLDQPVRVGGVDGDEVGVVLAGVATDEEVVGGALLGRGDRADGPGVVEKADLGDAVVLRRDPLVGAVLVGEETDTCWSR